MDVLLTDHLELRICSPGDAADFIDLERDPEVMHYLNGGAVDHANIDPNQVTFLMPRGYEPDVWTARWRETCKLAEISYQIRRRNWGKGFA